MAKNVGVEGIGFAIPVNMVRGVMGEIIAHGRVIRGWIGIVPEDLSEEQAEQLGISQAGVVIGNLYVGSPAQQAGLQPGDLLLTIDGTAPHSAQDALGRIASHKPGTPIAIRRVCVTPAPSRCESQGERAAPRPMTTLRKRSFDLARSA